MKNSQGKGVIRIGDKTSHGGTVISAQDAFVVLGKKVACAGDSVMCPRCKGVFPIRVAGSDLKHHGKPVAYDGDKAACGARLVSSIS